jgi:mannosyl-oligosaccharide alpha-1,2-mannosidase
MVLGDAQAYAQIAAAITESCVAMYTNTASGLGADGVEWVGSLPLESCLEQPASHEHADFRISSGHNLQRPETVESLYYLWRHTGDSRYQKLGWAIFSKLNQTRVSTGGFASVMDVNARVLSFDDLQQSFFIAEELKYFLLLFAQPEDVPIDQGRWIFNTEAHPLPVFDPVFPSSIGDVCSGAPFVCA